MFELLLLIAHKCKSNDLKGKAQFYTQTEKNSCVNGIDIQVDRYALAKSLNTLPCALVHKKRLIVRLSFYLHNSESACNATAADSN